MAQRGFQMDQDKLCCSICLDLLKDPVTLPCGHNYCMNCIRQHWDEEDQRHTHSCPQCRQTFTPRPALGKNTMLAELVEELKKTGLQAAPADHCYAGPGDVACEVCTGRKLKAIKSCLQCLVSYCEQHLQPHYNIAGLKKHILVDSSVKVQEIICSRHNEVMKIFCRTDQQCICYLCAMDEHRGHDTVSAAAEREEKQRELGLSQQKIEQRIKDKDKHIRVLQQKAEAINQSADKAVRDSEKIFTDLIGLIEKRSSDVKQQIRSKQKNEVSRVRELQEKIKQEIVDLRQHKVELERLSHIQDHITFLQQYPSPSRSAFSEEPPSINVHPLCTFDDVTAPLSEIIENMQEILKDKRTKISATASQREDKLLPQTEPTTRDDFLKYSQRITLDPNTANGEIIISDNNRKASVMKKTLFSTVSMVTALQSAERNPRQCFYVLSKETLTGRCYWEVEWSGIAVSIALTYRSRSVERGFGNDDRSWALYYLRDYFEFRHNSIRTRISTPRSYRIGVYLDHRAGILSFYSVSDTMTLLHRVQTTFTHPLYAAFFVAYGSAVELK